MLHDAHRRPGWFRTCCLIPPYVLERMAQHGDAAQRERAIRTLGVDHSLRFGRAQAATLLAGRPPVLDVLASLAAGKPQRTVYDAHSSEDLGGATVVRTEGAAAVADAAVNHVYENLGNTYKYYWESLQRNSIDDRGLPLQAYVHFGVDYDNAMWDGHRMIFGDGDGHLLVNLADSLDVTAHELTHGVTQYTSALAYQAQSGALNESLSDVFGSLVKQYTLKQTADEADWLIGAGCLGPDVKGKALRSMAAPGTAYDDMLGQSDPQVAHMRDYIDTASDNGGVHLNSGIPNHAFYLVATTIGGNAWEKAGRIWYDANRDPRMRPTVGFKTFAATTKRVASHLFGASSAEVAAVQDGWHQIGIDL
jgi:Zn-dependent metalloprotease